MAAKWVSDCRYISYPVGPNKVRITHFWRYGVVFNWCQLHIEENQLAEMITAKQKHPADDG